MRRPVISTLNDETWRIFLTGLARAIAAGFDPQIRPIFVDAIRGKLQEVQGTHPRNSPVRGAVETQLQALDDLLAQLQSEPPMPIEPWNPEKDATWSQFLYLLADSLGEALDGDALVRISDDLLDRAQARFNARPPGEDVVTLWALVQMFRRRLGRYTIPGD